MISGLNVGYESCRGVSMVSRLKRHGNLSMNDDTQELESRRAGGRAFRGSSRGEPGRRRGRYRPW